MEIPDEASSVSEVSVADRERNGRFMGNSNSPAGSGFHKEVSEGIFNHSNVDKFTTTIPDHFLWRIGSCIDDFTRWFWAGYTGEQVDAKMRNFRMEMKEDTSVQEHIK